MTAVSLVVAALLAVVVAQALLANGQVRLASLQHQLSLEQSTHRQAELSVSGLETPSRIVGAATSQLHMVRPANVVELPYVSLNTPLPTPKVTPAPAVAPTTTTTTSASGATGTTAAGSTATGTTGASGGTGSASGTSTSSGSSASGAATTTATSTP